MPVVMVQTSYVTPVALAAALLATPTSTPASTARAELNVMEQVRNIARTNIIQDAWRRDQPLELHCWIYGLRDGLIQYLGVSLKV